MPITDCLPGDIASSIPCLTCLSEKQLKALLVLLWAQTAGGYTLPADLDQLLADSSAFLNRSLKQNLEAEVAILASSEDTDLDTLIANSPCVQCLSPAQVDAAIIFLKCNFWTD